MKCLDGTLIQFYGNEEVLRKLETTLREYERDQRFNYNTFLTMLHHIKAHYSTI